MSKLETPLRTRRLMQGNEAIVEGAIAAGMNFYAGYPITPSTEIAEFSSERLPKVGGRFIQMEDEIASMAAVVGASLTGAKAMTATSGPGFSLKMENLGYAIHGEIPCVLVNVQRMGPSTGLPTSPAQGDMQQARFGSHGDYGIIALCPSSVEEAYRLTIRAFNLAERYRTPVILLADEVIGHLREGVTAPDPAELEIINRSQPTEPPRVHKPYKRDERGVPCIPNFGTGYRFHLTGLIHGEDGFATSKPAQVDTKVRSLVGKLEQNLEDIYQADIDGIEDADVVVFAYGCTARAAQRAVRMARSKGLKVGFYRPITIWPFHDEMVRRAIAGKKACIVPELNLGQMAREVERVAHGLTTVKSVTKVNGEILTPQEILNAIEEVC